MNPLSPSVMQLRGSLAESLSRGLSHIEVFKGDFTGTEAIADPTTPCVILMAEFWSQSAGAWFRIRPRNALGDLETGDQVRLPLGSGGQVVAVSQLRKFANKEVGYFRVSLDDATDRYAISMTRPMLLPNGGRVSVAAGEDNCYCYMQIGFFAQI